MSESGYKVVDTGKRETFATGSQRDRQEGRGFFELISVWGLMRLAQIYEKGAEKYDAHNWMKGQPISQYLRSILRHLVKYLGGCRDEDHPAAIAWNACGIMDHEERIKRGLLPAKLNDTKDWPKCFLPGEFEVKVPGLDVPKEEPETQLCTCSYTSITEGRPIRQYEESCPVHGGK